MPMLSDGRLPMTKEEIAAIEKLIADNAGTSVVLTRELPGEEGPVLVHIGDDTYRISEDGSQEKVA